jgi:hypothetical protein
MAMYAQVSAQRSVIWLVLTPKHLLWNVLTIWESRCHFADDDVNVQKVFVESLQHARKIIMKLLDIEYFLTTIIFDNHFGLDLFGNRTLM